MTRFLTLLAVVISSSPLAQAVPDCSNSRDPARCVAQQSAREACKERRGQARRQCREERMPPPDCAKARNPAACEAAVTARAACREKFGAEHQQCLREQIKAAKPPAKPRA